MHFTISSYDYSESRLKQESLKGEDSRTKKEVLVCPGAVRDGSDRINF